MRFVVDGAPFVFAGANIDPLHRARTTEQLAHTLDAVAADGLTVVRVWALGEGPADAPAWQRDQLFRAGPDGFIESTYEALDELLVEAHARKLRVMLTLVNAWPDFGGVAQYLRWASLPTTGYGAIDRFYDDQSVRAYVLAHVDKLVSRTNSISGVAYADDPTIFAWELMNESQVQSKAGALSRRDFVSDVTRYIRARDTSHMVTSGVVMYGTRAERNEWRVVCELPEVDFCDAHFYPQTSDRVGDVRALQERIDDRVQLAHFVVKKPLVFGEFGVDTRRDHDNWLGVPRDRMLGTLMSRLALDRVDGAMPWIYQPWSGKPRDFGIYTDRKDTDDVRAVVRRFAREIAQRDRRAPNPRIGPAFGDSQRYPVYQVMHQRGDAKIERADHGATVHLDPEHFTLGRFERLGTWDDGVLPHAYGAGDGFFEWRFVGPGVLADKIVLRARASSEMPGNDAPPDGGSIATVVIDDEVVGALEVATDDGVGAMVELTLDDPTLLARLKHGPHRLRIAVPPGPRANGLCLYGVRDGADVETSDITLHFLRRGSASDPP